MGRIFLTERDGPVYRCSACNTEIAQSCCLIYNWSLDLGLHEFSAAYNVYAGEVTARYCNNLYNGYEVNCVKCCAFLGWKEHDEEAGSDLFRLLHGRIVPPPENEPIPENPPPEDEIKP